MGALLSYSIESGLILLAMYLVYRLVLASDNQHSFNRTILLAIYAISFLSIPVINIVKSMWTPSSPTENTSIEAIASTSITEASTPLWSIILIWVYMAGIIFIIIRTIITWYRIIEIIRKGERITQPEGYTLVLTDNTAIAPFSWMRYMVMNHSDYKSCGNTITIHELRHIRYHHCFDLLVAQAVVIINWFNPAAWLMREELMLVHEFQADIAVIESGRSAKEYQLLLIKKAVGARFPSLANSLNHSKLKKRITMMYKSKSTSGARFKAIALAPAVALALLVATVPQVKAAISTISSSNVVDDKNNKISADTDKGADVFKFKNLNNNNGKTTVTIVGTIPSQSLSVKDVTLINGKNIYIANSINTKMNNGEAIIEATFPFLDKFDDLSIGLWANGKEYHMDINTDISVAITQSDVKSTLHTPRYFVNDKEVAPDYIKTIQPMDIESIAVDKKNNAIKMTLKK